MRNIIKKASFLTVFVSLVTFTSCDSRISLSKDIEGTWSSNAERIEHTDALNATASYLFQFTPDEGTDPLSGNFMLSALVEVTDMGAPSDLSEQAYSVSASAIASVEGTYSVSDDDEVKIAIAPLSYSVKVDPKAVILVNDIITDTDTSEVNDSISAVYAEHVKMQISQALKVKMTSLRKIDDIKVKDNRMKCEIDDCKLILSRD